MLNVWRLVSGTGKHPVAQRRTEWPVGFPPVYVHSPWASEADRTLPSHPSYWPAKKSRDASAAIRVCDDICQDDVLDAIFDACDPESGNMPLVVAPAATLHDSQNALALGYAKWLAHELGWEFSNDIFQAKTISRDFSNDGWFRIIHQPEFYGTVQVDRPYVIADDVCAMGGTIAGLRGFIESQGGRVMCCTALASGGGGHVRISLAERTLLALTTAHDGRLADVCSSELGYGVACLTEPEGRFLLRSSSYDEVRAGFDGARNPRTVR